MPTIRRKRKNNNKGRWVVTHTRTTTIHVRAALSTATELSIKREGMCLGIDTIEDGANILERESEIITTRLGV